MDTRTPERETTSPPRVTAPETILGPLAGALVGFAVFAISAVVLGALLGTDQFGLPDRDWNTIGAGAAVAAGLVLFVGFTYGGFVAGRLGGTGQHGLMLGAGTFAVAITLALVAGWAVQAAADGEQVDRYAESLRAFGVPGSLDGWRDVGTAAGISAIAGMLLGSMLGGSLATRHPRPSAARAQR
jgi:hypothetical protein